MFQKRVGRSHVGSSSTGSASQTQPGAGLSPRISSCGSASIASVHDRRTPRSVRAVGGTAAQPHVEDELYMWPIRGSHGDIAFTGCGQGTNGIMKPRAFHTGRENREGFGWDQALAAKPLPGTCRPLLGGRWASPRVCRLVGSGPHWSRMTWPGWSRSGPIARRQPVWCLGIPGTRDKVDHPRPVHQPVGQGASRGPSPLGVARICRYRPSRSESVSNIHLHRPISV